MAPLPCGFGYPNAVFPVFQKAQGNTALAYWNRAFPLVLVLSLVP